MLPLHRPPFTARGRRDHEDLRGEDLRVEGRPPVAAPLSELTPGRTSWSSARTSSVRAPRSPSASITTRASASVFEASGAA
jgi:hypothetical protein